MNAGRSSEGADRKNDSTWSESVAIRQCVGKDKTRVMEDRMRNEFFGRWKSVSEKDGRYLSVERVREGNWKKRLVKESDCKDERRERA